MKVDIATFTLHIYRKVGGSKLKLCSVLGVIEETGEDVCQCNIDCYTPSSCHCPINDGVPVVVSIHLTDNGM